jgi:hypothetical protein
MNVTIGDISRRSKAKINNNTNSPKNNTFVNVYNDNGNFLESNAINALHNWTNLHEDTNIAFNKALDVFIEICNNCNVAQINNECNFLLQEENKVRDAIHLQNSIKHKTSRLKTKISTKIQNKMDTASNNLGSSMDILKNKLKTPLGGPVSNNTGEAEGEVAEEAFNKLYEEAKVIAECDRILRNYDKICKRFDLDKIVSEVYSTDDIYESIIELCSCIDTYQLPFIKKYNTALEIADYTLGKNYMNYESKKIIEAVTDYFIFNTNISDSDRNDMKIIANNSVLFENADFNCISFLYNADNHNDNNSSIRISSPEYGINLENEISEKIKDDADIIKNDMKQWPKGNPGEHKDDDIKQMVQDFRNQCAKADKDDNNNMLISHFKSLINKIYSKNPDQIVSEIPNFFTLIRVTFIIGNTAINPVLGIITLITDLILKMHTTRKQTDRVINYYKDEISRVKTKINKAKDNNTKERLTKYNDLLKKDLEKIKSYSRDLYSDEENDERDSSSYDYDDDFDNNDDFDFGDDDFGLSESQVNNCATIMMISSLLNSLYEADVEDVDGMVAKNIYKFSNDTIDTITDFSITVPIMLEKDKLEQTLINYRNELREATNIDYMRIDTINENIYKLENSRNVYNTNTDAKSIMCSLMWLNELANINSVGYVNEMNITNTLKLAMNRLKNNAIKLSDKEKQISNNIDISVSNMSKGIEKAMMNNSRDSIIKGSILPSASKCIKMALVLGAEWAINPAIAVVTALGAFACQQRLSSKERQLVLDDIEIELKMCERYMRQAEEKNDMKAIRQIEQIQRNLERQQQRIKYRMKVIYKQNIPNAPGNDNED